MDAKEFVYGLRRMCKYYSGVCSSGGEDKEKVCPLNNYNCHTIRNMEDDVFDIVEYWVEQHPEKPKKTRQSEFLDRYPNAVGKDSVIWIRPCEIDDTKGNLCVTFGHDCRECRKRYWGEEIE